MIAVGPGTTGAPWLVSTRLAAAASVMLVYLGVTACNATGNEQPEEGSVMTEKPGRTDRSTTANDSSDADAGTPIRITIGDETVSATVWHNPTGQALLDQLPLTLTFEDLNGVEKTGHLPKDLTMDAMPAGDDPDAGDLGYYAPGGNLVLYYGDVAYWDGIARIGHIDGDLSTIADQDADFSAVVERAE